MEMWTVVANGDVVTHGDVGAHGDVVTHGDVGAHGDVLPHRIYVLAHREGNMVAHEDV